MTNHRMLKSWMLIAAIAWGATSLDVQAQYVFESSGTNAGNWAGANRWTIDGVSTGADFPNAIDALATFNLPLSTAPSGTFTIGFNGAPATITVGAIYVNNAIDGAFNTQFGTAGIPGNLTFQVSEGSAIYHESAGTGDVGTTVRPDINLLSDFILTQEHVNGGALNAGTTFSGKVNAASGITFAKNGNSNVNFSFNGELAESEGFFGQYVIEAGAMRFISNALLANAAGFTVNAGGQLQIGGAVSEIKLAEGATLVLNGIGVNQGPTNNDGAIRFQLNSGVTTDFNSPIELQSSANISVQNSDATAVARLNKAISGAGGLTKTGNGDLYLAGAESNTHAGGTGVSNGRLLLNKTGGAVAVPGNLNIGGTSIVVLQQNHQIADDSLVRFTSTTGQGILRLSTNRQETVGGLLSTNPGAGIIESNSNQAASLSTLTVDAIYESRFEGGIRDAFNTANQPGKLAIVKAGVESLELTNANSYSGGTKVTGGALLVNNVAGSGVGTGDLLIEGGIVGGRGFIGEELAPVNVSAVGGTIAPGDSAPGALSIFGNATFDASSVLHFDLAGATSGFEYDQLIVSGDVDLGGATLAVSLGDYQPVDVESFTLISNRGANPIANAFGNYAEGAAVDLNGVSYLLSYIGGDGNDLVLTRSAEQPISADFNGDGTVDGADFLIWQRGFDAPGGRMEGDANNDNVVNGADLLVWKDQYGAPAASPAVGAVPEPHGVVLLLIGSVTAYAVRRRLLA